jgi:hypothetical protein
MELADRYINKNKRDWVGQNTQSVSDIRKYVWRSRGTEMAS